MGLITELKIFYGRGQEIFSESFAAIEKDFAENTKTNLCDIMERHGSDKRSWVHNYTVLYSNIIDRFIRKPTDVFELGIGTNFDDTPSNMSYRQNDAKPGASLRGWREYFPTARICGADIDRRVIFQEERIQTLYVDQTDPNSISSLWEHVPLQFDLIVDDGLHEFSANREFLNCSKHVLKPNGIYIIEDIICASEIIIQYDKMIDESGMSGFLYRLPSDKNYYDNVVAVLVGPDWPGAANPVSHA